MEKNNSERIEILESVMNSTASELLALYRLVNDLTDIISKNQAEIRQLKEAE